MSRPYSLTEDEFDKLRRIQDSILLVTILLEEVQRPNSMTPQMMASFLVLLGEDMGGVLQSAGMTFSTQQEQR